MPLSWNEIRDRAIAFSREWSEETSEDAEAKSFLDDFFNVFGVKRRRVATFETKVKKLDGKDGFIDMIWPGKILIEMKSRGKDLDRAHRQAKEYFPNLKDAELPQYILVCDFARFRLYDLDSGGVEEFKLKDFHKHVRLFAFILGLQAHTYKEQDPVNIEAAVRMGNLHDELRLVGYEGHDLEVFLVRLLFCLFADDTGIFDSGIFHEYIKNRTSEDGSDLGAKLDELFQILNQPKEKRLKNLDEDLAQFDYINGALFSERLRTSAFNAQMRRQLLVCCELDWSKISPAIFGALFQSIMDDKARRNIGAHYTSEKNILKLIKPLFLDELWSEFNKIGKNANKLRDFHDKLRTLRFLDPACGCGNFLVITYRELRLLELEVLRAAWSVPSPARSTQGMRAPGTAPTTRTTRQLALNVHELILLDVDQFYGIEIEEFPAQIAQVALWLVDHQMNTLVGQEFGQSFARIPLKTSAKIVNGNALRIDWASIVPRNELSYILGNPPFVGSKFLTDEQKADLQLVFSGIKNSGTLDLVTGWYVKAAHLIKDTRIVCAFVSTNSIVQGEQAGILWSELLHLGIKIHFAHRTFMWRNEASGMAAVHCVIVGFASIEPQRRTIFDYSDIKGEPHAIVAKNINPYLVDAPDVTLPSRQHPLCDVPEIGIGNQPIDGGHYLFTTEQRDTYLTSEPEAKPYFRRWIGSDELINGYERWCLWLGDCAPDELRKLVEAPKRIQAVRNFRLESKRAATRKIADTPTRFLVENMPKSAYLAIPEVSSERRPFIPIGFEQPETFASNLLKVMPNATPYHFGILSSTMHMAWVRATCGRLKSDYRYSKDIVYNNFPWPVSATDKQKQEIEKAANGVLETRKQFPNSTLADLYDPLSMPPALVKAHQALDKAVDAAYGKKSFASEAERVAYLFELYQQLTAPLMGVAGKKKPAKRSNAV